MKVYVVCIRLNSQLKLCFYIWKEINVLENVIFCRNTFSSGLNVLFTSGKSNQTSYFSRFYSNKINCSYIYLYLSKPLVTMYFENVIYDEYTNEIQTTILQTIFQCILRIWLHILVAFIHKYFLLLSVILL